MKNYLIIYLNVIFILSERDGLCIVYVYCVMVEVEAFHYFYIQLY